MKNTIINNSDSKDSRTRFMEAADRVFLEYGYSRSTIRLISSEAKTSLARLNRHWTGKEQLFEDVLARHFDPIHEAQHARLDALEASKKSTDIRAILEAFLAPALISTKQQRTSHLIYCRALMDPAVEAQRIVKRLVQQLRPRVIGLLRKSFPDVDENTFFYIITTVMGAYTHPQTLGPDIAEAMGISYDDLDWSHAGLIIADLLVSGLKSQQK